MKRGAALASLPRDDHKALLVARQLRRAAALEDEPAPAVETLRELGDALAGQLGPVDCRPADG